ncbi:MAG: replication-associated recombination protein A [Ignavibacteria bacterium]|nr:replication-associated recombination protein A [Ignavibacteria bacterium]
MELFEKDNKSEKDSPLSPLAERLRPASLNGFVGQEHLTGPGKPLRLMIERKDAVSMILWGPPGTGKTTLALMIAGSLDADFISLSAVNSGVKEVRTAIEKADYNLKFRSKKTVVFIDEIHRFNKAQQDSLLHSVESGSIILIGATTENPSFEVISPLLSRCRVYTLNELNYEDLNRLVDRATREDMILREMNIEITDRDALIYFSGGDGRKLLNGLELAIKSAKPSEDGKIVITRELISETFQKNYIRYDKNAEEHYNLISAFIKSVRGGDPDAAVYWLARMLEGGEDPKFIARRMIILASEDIGNAEPMALTLAVSCFTAVDYIGMPEAQLVLSQTAIYLASCPKSNSSYIAIVEAKKDIEENGALPVPVHLRNAPTTLMKQIGYGKNYLYPHDFEGKYVNQQYLPDELKDRIYYKPGNSGEESIIRKRLISWWRNKKI